MNIIIGLLCSFFYTKIILPSGEGGIPLFRLTIFPFMFDGMIIVPFRTKAVHIHHWVPYLLICVSYIYFYVPHIILGFSVGLFIQGIMYKDSTEFICTNPYKN